MESWYARNQGKKLVNIYRCTASVIEAVSAEVLPLADAAPSDLSAEVDDDAFSDYAPTSPASPAEPHVVAPAAPPAMLVPILPTSSAVPARSTPMFRLRRFHPLCEL